jgi:predicted secreted hydrolase
MSEQNSYEQNFNDIVESLDATASRLLEGVTEAFVGTAETLRDGTEFDPLQLPRDLYAHHGVQTEWWYYTGHAKTETGNQFGFELVFFKRRTDLDKFGPVPMRLMGNPIYFAHFAITDYEQKSFKYAHRKSANGWLDDKATASEKHYYLRLGDWTIRESHGDHIMHASIGDDLIFEASLRPGNKVVLNGKNKDGVSFKDKGQASRYFSLTRMKLDGDITLNGETEHFSGNAWMDKEFGTWTPTEKQKGWDWFSIQLDNETDLMLYQLRDSKNNVSDYSSAVLVQKDGSFEPLSHEEFEVKPTGYWKSKNSGATYPSGWEITIDKKSIKLNITPVIPDQELDTRGTTMIIYWEGACEVSGTMEDSDVTGKSYVELVGYDRSHENPNLAHFLMSNRFESA